MLISGCRLLLQVVDERSGRASKSAIEKLQYPYSLDSKSEQGNKLWQKRFDALDSHNLMGKCAIPRVVDVVDMDVFSYFIARVNPVSV